MLPVGSAEIAETENVILFRISLLSVGSVEWLQNMSQRLEGAT